MSSWHLSPFKTKCIMNVENYRNLCIKIDVGWCKLLFPPPPTYLILALRFVSPMFYRPQQRAPSLSCSVPWRIWWSQGVTTWTVACTTTPCGSPSLLTTRDWPRNSGNPQKELLLPVGQNNCEWDSLLFVSAEWRIVHVYLKLYAHFKYRGWWISYKPLWLPYCVR